MAKSTEFILSKSDPWEYTDEQRFYAFLLQVFPTKPPIQGFSWSTPTPDWQVLQPHNYHSYERKERPIITIENFTRHTHICGERVSIASTTGGDMSNTSGTGYSPEFEPLDGILEDIWPEITYLQYRKLLSGINLHVGDDTETEYYGSSTTFAHKYATAEDLWQGFKKYLPKLPLYKVR